MIKEIQKDLFEEVDGLLSNHELVIICHCISSDLKMGAGIAKPLQDKYQIREDFQKRVLGSFWKNHGTSVITAHPRIEDSGECNLFLCNLITKEHYWDKPTYTTLSQSLENSRSLIKTIEGMRQKKVKIVMPRIGCGLDKLEWSRVKDMLITEFDKNEFDITVCYL